MKNWMTNRTQGVRMTRPITVVSVVAVWLSLLAACGEVRPPDVPRPAVQATYVKDIAPLLAARCVRCHSAGGVAGSARPAGGYDLSSYIGLLGPGSSEVRDAVAGDEKSPLLARLDPLIDVNHWGYLMPTEAELAPGESREARRETDKQLLRRWVVEAKLAYNDVLIHPPGWLYPGDRNAETFHGGTLRQRSWNLDTCTGCHGRDYRGGTAGVSCYACHQDGPEGCTACHGDSRRGGPGAAAPPTDLSWNLSSTAAGVGAHQAHLKGSSIWAGAACTDCHRVPATLRDPDHLGTDLKAEVVFSGVAAQGATSGYDEKNFTCAGVYCHGGPLADPTAMRVDVKWNKVATLGCDSCHGVPGKGLGGPECQLCHQQSVASCTPGEASCIPTGKRLSDGVQVGVRFLQLALHLDGKVPLGRKDATTTCEGCHGSGAQGAPPPDLHGSSDATSRGAGAHAAHLKDGPLAKAVPCEQCHVVPKTITDKGHVDSDLPAEVTFGDRATGASYGGTVDTKPKYDAATQSCSSTACHSRSGGQQASWVWSKPITPTCTSCHGQPPTTTLKGAAHPQNVTDCKTCHGSAYVNGQLDPAKHMNGKVDL